MTWLLLFALAALVAANAFRLMGEDTRPGPFSCILALCITALVIARWATS